MPQEIGSGSGSRWRIPASQHPRSSRGGRRKKEAGRQAHTQGGGRSIV